MNRIRNAVIFMLIVLTLAACEQPKQTYGPAQYPGPVQNVPDLPIQDIGPTPTPPVEFCTVTFLSPASNASLPNYGPVEFNWSLDAADWITNKLPFDRFMLVIIYPGGNPAVHYETQDENKTLYMENYDPAGTYTAQVRTMSNEDEVLCWDQITFTKTKLELKINEGPEPAISTPCAAGPCP